ncbi:MAG: aconitate hydratase [Bacteroidales bacterium]|nr:aconitate hydratase [Bacteroidales bacterium]
MKNVSLKILEKHLTSGELIAGKEISIGIDQTLTQDSTGTMVYLQLEAMKIQRVKTQKSVAYIDHNTLQTGFENADDHKYIQTVASKHGIYFSKPGNGICHQVHLERFGKPGFTLLGSDSHTPTCGALGMLAIGAGGLDVAVAMAGGSYNLIMPEIINVKLNGKLKPWVTAKDIILELLRILTVKGGVGKIIEYSGSGVETLSIPERATITNMGAELGATTSVFPSDEITLTFLKKQKRENDWSELKADIGASYSKTIEINLDDLEPLAAKPHSPDNVDKVKNIGKIKVDQVAIGSCTNSSFTDMMKVAAILKNKTIAPSVSLVIAPGSKQVLTMLAKNGALADMISSGARILESACGPCIGMGQSPASDAVSLRTFNRNFEGRSGTKSAQVYLVSPETAAVSAITGCLTDPHEFGAEIKIEIPDEFEINDNLIISPAEDGLKVEVVRGENIKPFPLNKELSKNIEGKILIKLGDNITTDDIMPSNAKLLPFRSNVPYLSEFCLTPCDADFPKKAKENGGGFIIGGINYGQGSSREHAALVLLQLGVKGVIAKSFARIHSDNLVNSGIIPMVFENAGDYDKINLNNSIEIENIIEQIKNKNKILIKNKTKNLLFTALINLSERQKEIIIAGGLLNSVKNKK